MTEKEKREAFFAEIGASGLQVNEEKPLLIETLLLVALGIYLTFVGRAVTGCLPMEEEITTIRI